MKVIVLNEAKQDLRKIFKYIAKNSLKYAIETDRSLRLAIHKLEESPYIGRYVLDIFSKQYRELIYKSYRIIYEVSESKNIVYIHFIVHCKRDFKSFYKYHIKNN